MTAPFSRRAFIGAAGASATALALPATTPSAHAGEEPSEALVPFPLSDVSLLDGPFQANMARTCDYLEFIDADRLLHTFRLNAGLPSSAEPCGGWEAPDVLLRGHSTGHLLSGLAQAHANTGDDAFAAKGRYIVAELAKCQQASPSAGFNAGYLSAFPESVFDDLESGGRPWAPYYTIHKIMAGLLDQYRLSGDRQALTVVEAMAFWADVRTGKLTHEQMQEILGVEFGGMNDVLAALHQVTKDPAHLETARRFDHEEVYGPLAERRDALDGHHANTQIPKIVGAMREYEATGDARYRDIAAFFWDTVVHDHTYVIGGNSNNEMALKLRIPGWLGARGRHPRVRVNGRAVPIRVRPGSYAEIERHWRSGDVVESTMPMDPVWRKAPDNPNVQAVTVGPVVLAGRYGDRTLDTFPAIDPRSLRPDRRSPLHYRAKADGADVELKPFGDVQHERYNVYWLTPAHHHRRRLLAHFPLQGRSLADTTGRWPDATLVAGASWQDGGDAVVLDGEGGHVLLPPGLLGGLEELTVAMRVRLDSLVNNVRVFDLGFNRQTYFALTARNGSGIARFTMRVTGMEGEDQVDAPSALPTGVWTHVAVTVGNGSAVLYIDHAEAGRNDDLVMSPLALGATTRNHLGDQQDTRRPHLHGAVSAFRLYDHALSAVQISALADQQ